MIKKKLKVSSCWISVRRAAKRNDTNCVKIREITNISMIYCLYGALSDYWKRPTICTDCTAPLLYILAPTRFGSILPSSGSFLDPSELFEIQIEWVVYHIMCGYVTCVLECRGSNGTTEGTTANCHIGHCTHTHTSESADVKVH
jgi:hypothetical protein